MSLTEPGRGLRSRRTCTPPPAGAICTCDMDVALITLGDPARLTGGYLYHRRMAELASRHNARLRFVSLPDGSLLSRLRSARSVVEEASSADVVVIDSIAAAPLARHVHTIAYKAVGMLHQEPGGIDERGVKRTVLRRLDLITYRQLPCLMVASDQLNERLTAEGFAPDVLVVVAPGKDMPASGSVSVGDLRHGSSCAFLAVGNWVERKGIADLVEAFARGPHASAVLHLVGDNEVDERYSGRVEDALARPELEGRVFVHGPVPKEIVAAFYEAADVFVLPSRKEPYGTVYGEAMASGLPVVGWDAGNLPYLATNGREGSLVPTGDIDALAAALTKLASDAALRDEMSRRARRRAETFPTWEESAARFYSVLRGLARSS